MSEQRKADIQIRVRSFRDGRMSSDLIEFFGSYQWGYKDVDHRYRVRFNRKWHGGNGKKKVFYGLDEIGHIVGVNIVQMIRK